MKKHTQKGAQIRELLFCLDIERRKKLRPYFDEIGLTPGQPRVISCLDSKEHITQRELAGMCKLDPATLSRNLDKLAEAGLISRMPHPTCRRSFLIELTQEGRETALKVRKGFALVDDRLLTGFSEEEGERLRIALERIYQNLSV